MRAAIISHLAADPARRGKLRALAGLGHQLAVAVPDRWLGADGVDRSVAPTEEGGLQVAPVRVRGELHDPAALSWQSRPLHRLLSGFRPEILQIEVPASAPAAGLGERLARRLGIPLVVVGTEHVSPVLGFWATRRRDRVMQAARGLVGVSGLALQRMQAERSGLPGAVVPLVGVVPPVHPTREAHHGLSIGFVGRLVKEKGLDVLFRGVAMLIGDWSLTVVGNGPEREALERLAEHLGIAARLTWLDGLPAEELPRVWRQLDCLVVPSRTTATWVEGVNPTVLDAMAHGVAIVGTRCGALPELIGEAGMLVPEDSPDEMVRVLGILLGLPAQREMLATQARRRVMAEFVDDALARRTAELWAQVRATH